MVYYNTITSIALVTYIFYIARNFFPTLITY